MSLNINDLWIGDQVKLMSSGKVGTFEGKISAVIARVKIEGRLLNVPCSDLAIYKESPISVDEILQSQFVKNTAQKTSAVPDEIDLHIKVLDSSMSNQMPERILHFQIQKASQYIEAAIQKRKYKIKIIHGKGTGVLKTEIKHLLKSYKHVLCTHEVSNGGAIEVLFTY